jgi:hypothetical protein
MDVQYRLQILYDDLSGVEGKASWATASSFNALLDEVKKDHGDDPVVTAIPPAQKGAGSTVSLNSNQSLRIAAGQLLAVVKGH